jgi:uncharacterized membrane protein
MTEFKIGIFNLLKKLIGGSSATLAVTYTVGHIFIAMTCNRIITGAALDLAAIDAIIEPCINGVWFYILHNTWKRYNRK